MLNVRIPLGVVRSVTMWVGSCIIRHWIDFPARLHVTAPHVCVLLLKDSERPGIRKPPFRYELSEYTPHAFSRRRSVAPFQAQSFFSFGLYDHWGDPKAIGVVGNLIVHLMSC